MINETEIGTCRHCGTKKDYFSKCSLKVQMTTDMVHDLQKRANQIWWRDFACEKSSIWLFETPSLDSHDTLYKFQQSSLCYRSISTSLCQGPFSGGVCYISHKRLFLMTKKLHETTAKTIKLLYRIFEKSFPNYPAFTTGSSTTNPAKVAAVFWCLDECNSKFLSIFQLSTKDNFKWCILIQLNISCLFTILELKIAWDLLLLTKKLCYFSIVYDMNQFSKLNHHWNMIVKGRQL